MSKSVSVYVRVRACVCERRHLPLKTTVEPVVEPGRVEVHGGGELLPNELLALPTPHPA